MGEDVKTSKGAEFVDNVGARVCSKDGFNADELGVDELGKSSSDGTFNVDNMK